MASRRLRLLLAFAVPLWIVWLIPYWVEARGTFAPALGSPFTVTAVTDAPDFFPGDGVCEIGAGNGICTLRAAVQEANAWPGVDTILFSALIPTPTTFLLTRSGSDSTALNGDLDVTDGLIVSGRGSLATIIDAGGMITPEAAIEVRGGGVLTISGVTIRNSGDGILGAIDALGRLTVRDSVIANNPGRGVRVHGGLPFLVENSSIRNNATGVYVTSQSTAHIVGSVLSANWDHAVHLPSGGSTLYITSSNIISNGSTSDTDRGGGVEAQNSSVHIYDTLFQGNRAQQGAGVAFDSGGGRHDIVKSRFVGNTAGDYGGALAGYATIVDSEMTANRAGNGGALYVVNGLAALTRTVIAFNHAYTDGGGIYVGTDVEGGWVTAAGSTVADNGADQRGGGIFNASGLELQATTVARNESVTLGGGLYVNTLTVTRIVNSTFSGNRTDGWGGGIYLFAGTTHLTHTTVYSNIANDNYDVNGIGGGVRQVGGTLYARASIIARNKLRMNVDLYVQDDCAGTVQSLNYNYIGDLGGCTVLGSTSLNQSGYLTLGPLGLHGGPTQTHVPPRGNSVIDGAINTQCPATDQRGTPRPFDGNGNGVATCDIGAVEYVPDVLLPLIMR